MNELERLKQENEELKRIIENLEKRKGELQKKGMIKKAEEGKIMSRAAWGYKIEKGKLIPAENFRKIEEIFLEFKNSEKSLNQLSKKYGLSVNGLKKILTNFTYIGKIKFNGQIHPGTHKPLLSSILFNQVQDKLERKGIKLKSTSYSTVS